MPLSRFELFVILRNQVSDRRLVRRALAVEAVMEELAAEVGADAGAWALAGLGANIDAQLLASGFRRGEVAEELLLTEGAPADVARAARERLELPPARLDPLPAALVAAEALVEEVHGALEAEGEAASLDAVEPAAIAHRLRRLADKRGDEAALRALACLARVGVPLERAAELAVAAFRRVREDLKL